jgi:hypothetical protein
MLEPYRAIMSKRSSNGKAWSGAGTRQEKLIELQGSGLSVLGTIYSKSSDRKPPRRESKVPNVKVTVANNV